MSTEANSYTGCCCSTTPHKDYLSQLLSVSIPPGIQVPGLLDEIIDRCDDVKQVFTVTVNDPLTSKRPTKWYKALTGYTNDKRLDW